MSHLGAMRTVKKIYAPGRRASVAYVQFQEAAGGTARDNFWAAFTSFKEVNIDHADSPLWFGPHKSQAERQMPPSQQGLSELHGCLKQMQSIWRATTSKAWPGSDNIVLQSSPSIRIFRMYRCYAMSLARQRLRLSRHGSRHRTTGH